MQRSPHVLGDEANAAPAAAGLGERGCCHILPGHIPGRVTNPVSKGSKSPSKNTGTAHSLQTFLIFSTRNEESLGERTSYTCIFNIFF